MLRLYTCCRPDDIVLQTTELLLHDAEEAVKKIQKGDLRMLKALSKPPVNVKGVMNCIQLLVGPMQTRAGTTKATSAKSQNQAGKMDLSWSAATKMLGSGGFIARLTELSRDLSARSPHLRAVRN